MGMLVSGGMGWGWAVVSREEGKMMGRGRGG
jgi:hypothetical protein